MALVGRVLTVECPCAGTPHEVDTITFREVLPLAGGMAAMQALVLAARQATEQGRDLMDSDLAVALFPVILDHGIVSWTFLRADEPLPVTKEADTVLPFGTKFLIADAADDLFGEEITRPLAGMTQRSSPRGRTGSSTSPTRRSGRTRRSPSAPSSPAASAASEP